MSRELEIICIACKCSKNDEDFNKRLESLPAPESDEFLVKSQDFRKRHNHSKCIVRTVKSYKHEQDIEYRKNLIANRK